MKRVKRELIEIEPPAKQQHNAAASRRLDSTMDSTELIRRYFAEAIFDRFKDTETKVKKITYPNVKEKALTKPDSNWYQNVFENCSVSLYSCLIFKLNLEINMKKFQ